MSDYLSKTGLSYFYNRIKTLFASKTEFNTLKGQVDELVAEGGEPNVIETVKVNGTALTPAAKAVDITVPTNTSDLTNDGDGNSPFATESYVDENGGKIDKVKVNGVEQPITAKVVDLNVSEISKVSNANEKSLSIFAGPATSRTTLKAQNTTHGVQLSANETTDGNLFTKELVDKSYTDSTFRTEQQVQAAIDAALADVTSIDYQIVDTLPATGSKGIIYLIPTGTASNPSYDEYIWLTPTTGTPHFEKFGTTDIDLSGYWGKTELVAITTAEIDEILA